MRCSLSLNPTAGSAAGESVQGCASWRTDPDRRRATHQPTSNATGSLDARDRQCWVGGLGEQRGAILPIMALLLVVLLGVAGFAVDLGWIFWNSIEIQHGADAAALGGVVYVADDVGLAKAEGRAAAASNTYSATAVWAMLRLLIPNTLIKKVGTSWVIVALS